SIIRHPACWSAIGNAAFRGWPAALVAPPYGAATSRRTCAAIGRSGAATGITRAGRTGRRRA
ncbi:hypothetical protein RZS08_38475, partial [Arthrospira platensis SPKY1]|nr:hypothetical protein [Arthrospira platensis SPKY1]